MRRYIVVAHKTLGGAHLVEYLHELREQDPYCTFHLIVPEHHPLSGWDEHGVHVATRGNHGRDARPIGGNADRCHG